MRMHLRWEFPNGHFGDPALYVWELNTRHALLFDCGDLSRFTTRQLLKVGHIFLSHCHIDHFFGFDHFLRIHVGSEKSVTIIGPPDTSNRVAGKLMGYTWNLIWDQNLQFHVIDLNSVLREKRLTSFHARNGFQPSPFQILPWNIKEPVFETESFKVSATTLDHRTPSMAYAVEEKITMAVNTAKLKEMGFKTGPWITELKSAVLAGDYERPIHATMKQKTEPSIFTAAQLADWLLLPRHRHKIAYVTDGAAHEKNFRALVPLVEDADILFAETCFMEQDRPAADETKHFTTTFIARMAQEANIKRLIPFHFSKRYLSCPEAVLSEVSNVFSKTVVNLAK